MPIKGIEYTGSQTEYQYFPEDYFSGSDITLYFDDVYMDDIQSLQFGLTEKVLPVYGYNSYRWDAVSRGQRVVQGSFTIAFKEAGYIYAIMNHIGQGKAEGKPLLAYALGDKQKSAPEWVANMYESIDEILNRQASAPSSATTMASEPKWPTMDLPDNNASVKEYQNFLLSNADGTRYKGITKIAPIKLTGAGSSTKTYKSGSKAEEVKTIKTRLNQYLYTSGSGLLTKPLDAKSNVYDAATVAAVKAFQKNFSTSLAVDGMVGPKTMAALNQGLTANGTFDAPTKLATMNFQKANGLTVDGIVGPKTRSKMKIDVAVASQASGGAVDDFAAYEASVWGEQSTISPNFNLSPYFYGEEQQQWLRQDGFDIYINYGELPQNFKEGSKVDDMVTYNNTVRAVRNVQLTTVEQVISPTGEAIAERYSFIARDLD